MNSRVRAAAANCPRSLVLFRHYAERVYGMWQCSTLELQLIAQRTRVCAQEEKQAWVYRPKETKANSICQMVTCHCLDLTNKV